MADALENDRICLNANLLIAHMCAHLVGHNADLQPENLPVVQHSPSVHSYSAHTWLEASAMRTFPDDSQAVNVSHRGAEKTKRQKMPDSVHKNKDTKEKKAANKTNVD